MTVSRLRSHFSRPPKPAGTSVEAALGIIAPKAAHTVAGSMSQLVRGIMLNRMATAWSDGATLEDQVRGVIRPLEWLHTLPAPSWFVRSELERLSADVLI